MMAGGGWLAGFRRVLTYPDDAESIGRRRCGVRRTWSCGVKATTSVEQLTGLSVGVSVVCGSVCDGSICDGELLKASDERGESGGAEGGIGSSNRDLGVRGSAVQEEMMSMSGDPTNEPTTNHYVLEYKASSSV